MNEAIITSILILSFYIIILMLSDDKRSESRKFVFIIIIIIASSQIPLLIINKLRPEHALLVEKLPIKLWSLLIGPALLFYARTCMGRRSKLLDLLHLLPALIWWIVFLVSGEQQLHNRKIMGLFGLSNSLALLFYGAFILLSLRRYTQWLRNQYSYTNTFLEVKWLSYTAVFLIVHTLATSLAVSMLQWIFPPKPFPHQMIFRRPTPLDIIHSIGILTFLFIFSIMAHKQEQHQISRQTDQSLPKKNVPKEPLGVEFDVLTRYVKESKIYLENTLTLQQLSEQSGISRNVLSGLINSETGENFFHFINGYRAREFYEVIQNNKYPNYTLLGIAHECGFNSKTTFIAAIKREYGKTPSQILQEVGPTL